MTGKRFVAVLGAGLAAAQAGHLAAYELRFAGAAQQLQSSGAHSYFPSVVRTVLGLAAALALASMLVVGVARLAAGRRVQPGSAPSFWRLLPVLYTVQLACFAAQETAEAMLGGGHASSAPLLLLWGAAGQLPVAVLTSLALRWLLASLEPALGVLRPRLGTVQQFLAFALEVRAQPVAAEVTLSVPVLQTSYRRGPPSF